MHNLVIGMFLTECYSSGSCFLQLLLLGGGRALGWGEALEIAGIGTGEC
jgi:hypothetical protein